MQYACPPLDFNQQFDLQCPQMRRLENKSKPERRFQFVLGAVSARWRQVTFSTPQLWTSIGISVKSTTIQQTSEILQIFLVGSGELPISLTLRFLDSSEQEDAIVLPLLCQHARRIQELHLDNPPRVWTYALSTPHHRLVRLSIDNTQASMEPLLLNTPCAHLTLRYTNARIELCWSTITVLHLFELRIDVCLELLRECVNLVEYRSQAPSSDLITSDIPLPTSPFILPYLKTFEWSLYKESLVDQTMLQNIRMPALDTLVWIEEIERDIDDSDDEDQDLDDPSDPRNIFFASLSPTLRALYLGDVRGFFQYSAAVRCLVRKEFNIDHLVIGYCHGVTLNPLIQILTIDEQNRTFLQLRTITLHAHTMTPVQLRQTSDDSLEGVDFNALLRMVESRLSYRAGIYPQQSMRLEIKVHLGPVEWPLEFKKGMKELVQRGLELVIVENAEAVSWL
jgi:hypothetical protein